jgi:hypothetical protein
MKRLLATLTLLCACGTTPPTPDPPVPVEQYDLACARLAELGCQEGLLDNCARVLRTTNEDFMAVIPTACILEAQTVEAVRSCPGIECRQ